ncbi:MAG: nitrogen regulation protein NR(II) [Thiotrichales bacterium]
MVDHNSETHLILEHMDTAVLLLDQRLGVVFLNPAGEMLFEKSLKRIRNRKLTAICPTQRGLIELIQSAIRDGAPISRRELSLRLPSGREIIVNLTCTPIGEGGALIEVQQIARLLNITQDEVRQKEYSALRQLARGLAHEVKNPLGGIRGAAQLLQAELENPELHEYTQVIISETDRLQVLIDRILGPRRPPNKQSLSIHEVTEHVRRLLQAEANRNVRIDRDYDPSIPELRADRDQLVQAVLNIARNALEALSKSGGRIVLRTRVSRHYTIDGTCHPLVIRLQIEDDGPGVPETLQPQIFFPMVTNKANGSGLGLSIAESLISGHGGLIKFHSEPGKTIFEILLPYENTHE